ncbi:MAG: hypothetical protein R3E79_23360 [Caldilineaceae bacterium]
MKTIQVTLPEHVPVAQTGSPPTIPVSIPALEDVIQLATALHAAGKAWEGTALGWPADYTPEIYEKNAVFEEYDENGVMHPTIEDRWSPAMFCIGINGIWFASLAWESGINREPWLYLENDYGYTLQGLAHVTLLSEETK